MKWKIQYLLNALFLDLFLSNAFGSGLTVLRSLSKKDLTVILDALGSFRVKYYWTELNTELKTDYY